MKLSTSRSPSPTLGLITQSPLTRIIVGQSQTLFYIHSALLCHYSSYFAAACNGRWAEATEGVTLDDIDEQVFRLFVHWLYTQCMPDSASELMRLAAPIPPSSPPLEAQIARKDAAQKAVPPRSPKEPKRDALFLLLRSAVFADRILCPLFATTTHNTFVTLNGACPVWYDQVAYAFAHLPSASAMLKFMVDMQCMCWKPQDDSKEEKMFREKLPMEFLVRVMCRFGELRVEENGEDDWAQVDIGKYLINEDMEEEVDIESC